MFIRIKSLKKRKKKKNNNGYTGFETARKILDKNGLEKGESVAQAIDRLFFSSSANLQSEYKRLFASLFNKPEPYLDIIRILSNSRQGISRDEIIKLLDTI